MRCSRCVETTDGSDLRSFWKQVPPADKRQYVTGGGAVAAACAGWGAAGLLGGLVGLFLGGCVGGLVGLARFRDAAVADAGGSGDRV